MDINADYDVFVYPVFIYPMNKLLGRGSQMIKIYKKLYVLKHYSLIINYAGSDLNKLLGRGNQIKKNL